MAEQKDQFFNCQQCGYSNRIGAKFCQKCGVVLPPVVPPTAPAANHTAAPAPGARRTPADKRSLLDDIVDEGEGMASDARNIVRAVGKMIFGEIKICGLVSPQSALTASQCGAVYGGVIFAQSSPRRVDPARANEILQDAGLVRVGVFQDQPIDEVVQIVNQCQLQVVQLHGKESIEYVRHLQENMRDATYHDVEIWKAVSVDQLTSQGQTWLAAGIARLLVDNQSGKQTGGTGQTFDWTRLPSSQRDRIMIAGGIGPDNVGEALRLGCAGVDMNSCLEDAPGRKSAEKIKLAFAAIRNY